MRRAAFTLVELLVVIGVIAVLISMLLPALNRARDSAKTLSCLSNLRQIQFGLLQYFRDNRDMIPYSIGPGYSEFNGAPNNIINIQEALAKAFPKTPQVGFGEDKPNDWRICPKMWDKYGRIFSGLYVQYSSNAYWRTTNDGNSNAFSYSVPHTGTLPDGRFNDWGFQGTNDARKATRIKPASEYPWFADTIPEYPRLGYGPDVAQPYGRLPLTWFDSMFPNGYLGVAPYHDNGKTFNASFHDGHCETIAMKTLIVQGVSFFQMKR